MRELLTKETKPFLKETSSRWTSSGQSSGHVGCRDKGSITKYDAMDTQVRLITTQVQGMMVESNREIKSPVNLNSYTMASRLRDFSIINPAIFFWSKVYEKTHDFLDKVQDFVCYGCDFK